MYLPPDIVAATGPYVSMLTPSWIHYVLPALTTVHALTTPKPVKLAIDPVCGSFGGSPLDVGQAGGLQSLRAYKDIVAFGDGFTDAGRHAFGPVEPPVIKEPNPRAGGRKSNGPVWVEFLAAKNNATLHDYAVVDSVIDASYWESMLPGKYSPNADLVYQVNDAVSNGRRPAAKTTLYTIFYGTEDIASAQSLNHWERIRDIAEVIVYEMTVLLSYPNFATDFLIVDDSSSNPDSRSKAFKEELFMSVGLLRENFPGINVGFVDLKTLWDGIRSKPASFGYSSTGACLKDQGETTVGACRDPDHTLYWAPGTPSKVTHSIMSDYVEKVLKAC